MTLLDTRTAEEYAGRHIEGFVNNPVDELRERLGELNRGKPAHVICQSGLRSYIACRILSENDFDCYNFSGGFRFYDAVVNDRRLIEQATACDGMFYKDKTVVIAGGGNTAAADALILARICKKVILVHRRDSLRATKIYHEPLMKTENWSSIESAGGAGLASPGKKIFPNG